MDHVVMANNKSLCRGCGASYDLLPGGKPREVWEFAALAKAFGEQHAGCADKPLRCASCGGEHDSDACNGAHKLTKETWIDGHDTGLSSETIWCFMSGVPFALRLGGRGPCYPLDPSDFGRCYRLLALAPEWRARIGEMASVKGWEKMAPAWDEMTALYEREIQRPDGNAPELYDLMLKLRGVR